MQVVWVLCMVIIPTAAQISVWQSELVSSHKLSIIHLDGIAQVQDNPNEHSILPPLDLAKTASGRAAPRTWRFAMLFEVVNDWMSKVMSQWPHPAVLGFKISFAAVLLTLPIFMILALVSIWSIASVGPARKTFSSIFVVSLGLTVYPALSLLVLLIVWFVLYALVLAFSVVAPIGAAIGCLYMSCSASQEFRNQQRMLTPVVNDIGFGGLFGGLAVGIASSCTFGLITIALTLLKAPILFLACIAHSMRTLPQIFKAGCCCPLAAVLWLFLFACGVIILPFCILISILLKWLVSLIWPAYVATGWLRHFGGGGRRISGTCCTPFVQGFKAGYQVLWAADLFTNACIRGRFDLLEQSKTEFLQIAAGERQSLSEECRRISCLPPVIIGLYQGDAWDMAEEYVARQLGVKRDKVQEAWKSLADQMKQIGREGLAAGLLDEDYVLSVPPELVIGLPARVLLDTVERSTGSGMELASGLTLTENKRPRGQFPDLVWDNLQQAKRSLPGIVAAGPGARECLCGILLAGGGNPDELPFGLAQMVRSLDTLPEASREAILAVQRPLIAIAVEGGRQRMFREKLQDVLSDLSA